jgi:hypothetical protein
MKISHSDEFAAELRICRTCGDDDSCMAAIGGGVENLGEARYERPFISAAIAHTAAAAQTADPVSLSAI